MDNRSIILDIAMNLNRVGNWAADGYDEKKARIKIFLSNTTQYIRKIELDLLSPSFRRTYDWFLKDYPKLEREGLKGPNDSLKWAEEMMTWGNILTHRSKLLP